MSETNTPANPEFSRAKTPALSVEDARILSSAWSLATPNGSSPYLALKGVGAFGTASSPGGALYVPMRDADGELKNLQRLEAPNENGATKGPQNSLVIKDANIEGLQHLIGQIQADQPIVFSADYAEAAAIHQSTGLPVVVTFSDENTPAVVDQYLEKASQAKAKLVLHVKKAVNETSEQEPFVALAALPNVEIFVAGGTQKIEGFEGFTGKSLAELMQQFGGKAVKSLVDEAATRPVTATPASDPVAPAKAVESAEPVAQVVQNTPAAPAAPATPAAVESAEPAVKISWSGPWTLADDGLTSVRQVVGQFNDGAGYLAGHQKMIRGSEVKPQWDEEQFEKFPEAELRSKLLALRALDATARPATQANGAPAAEAKTIEKVEAGDPPLASAVDDILLKLKSQYLLAENNFYFRDKTKTVAFTDASKHITTKFETSEIARSMLELAQAKGWTHVKLNGSDEFKRKTWLEAEMLGIQTSGYTPDGFDKSELAQRKVIAEQDALAGQNSISQALSPAVQVAPGSEAPANATATQAQAPQVTSELAARYGTRLAQDLRKALAQHGHDPQSAATNDALDYVAGLATSPRVFVGKLLEHGPAPYEFNEKATASYFVRMETPQGEKTVWGVTIPQALSQSSGAPIAKGDDILLAFKGSEPVTVRDELTGVAVHTHRNTWYAEKVADLPAVSQASADKPTYTAKLANPAAPQAKLDAKQTMMAQVMQQKGAPPEAINKALAATANAVKPTPMPAPVITPAAKPAL